MTKPTAIYYSMLKYQAENIELLHREFEVIELASPVHDTDDLLAKADILFAPLGYMTDQAKIDKCPNLKVIVSNTTGHPHIDVAYAKERNIDVACLKFAQSFLKTITPTAELTWGLIIMLTRGLMPASRAALSGVWDRRPFGAPAMLSNMKIGIVGYGRLGSMVANYARAFGMDVLFHDPFISAQDAHPNDVRCNTIEDLLPKVDILSLHIPHEPDTENLISADRMRLMKKGAYLVNTARGEIIDWDALLKLLQSGHLAGAALDVFQGEFHPEFSSQFAKHPVLDFARKNDNLLLTPHIGGSTYDAWRQTEGHAIQMALDFLAQKKHAE